jgi:hypothetical protein
MTTKGKIKDLIKKWYLEYIFWAIVTVVIWFIFWTLGFFSP